MDIIRKLSKEKIPCQLIDHKAFGRKSEKIAPLLGLDPKKDVLKTLTFMSPEGKVVHAVISKYQTVDESKLSSLLGFGPLSLAKANQVLQLTGSELGGVCPIGSKFPVAIESKVTSREKVLISAGSPETSILISGKNLLKAIPEAVVGEFTRDN